jgi:hypothetical protein
MLFRITVHPLSPGPGGHGTRIVEVTGTNYHEGAGSRCWDCHRDVPHGTVRSLGSAPAFTRAAHAAH